MMKYKVISAFNDITDSNFLYKVGDVYPKQGTHPTDTRIKELLSDANMQHKPLIVTVDDSVVDSDEKIKETPPKRKRGKKNENS